METVAYAAVLVALAYFFGKPDEKKPVGRPKKAKKFGQGLLIDSDGERWWNSDPRGY